MVIQQAFRNSSLSSERRSETCTIALKAEARCSQQKEASHYICETFKWTPRLPAYDLVSWLRDEH
jgi:hypothetical protein